VSLDWALLEYDLRPVNAGNKIIIAIWAVDIEEFHLLLRLVIAVDNAISIVIHDQGTAAKEGAWWQLVVAIVTPLWDNVCTVS
jgi:mannose-6-phosphate isomerase class I